MANFPRTKILPHIQNKKPRFSSEADLNPLENRTRRRLRMALAAAAMIFALFVIYPIVERTVQRDADGGAIQVTECDRLAAHPADTQKLAAGVAQDQMDTAAARAACHSTLTKHPSDGRTLYQLGRTYSAAGDITLGLSYIRKSADAGYAQGEFALADSLMHDGDPRLCEGAQWLLKAARQRHFPAKLALALNQLNGTLQPCALDVSNDEISEILSSAGELAETDDERNELATIQARWNAGTYR